MYSHKLINIHRLSEVHPKSSILCLTFGVHFIGVFYNLSIEIISPEFSQVYQLSHTLYFLVLACDE